MLPAGKDVGFRRRKITVADGKGKQIIFSDLKRQSGRSRATPAPVLSEKKLAAA